MVPANPVEQGRRCRDLLKRQVHPAHAPVEEGSLVLSGIHGPQHCPCPHGVVRSPPATCSPEPEGPAERTAEMGLALLVEVTVPFDINRAECHQRTRKVRRQEISGGTWLGVGQV
jgi:hypothetical protein